MPAAPAAPPPAAAPASVGSVAPPSGGEIHVTPPTSLNEGNPTVAPPKPGSARAKLSADLRKVAGIAEPEPRPGAPDPKKGKPAAPPAEPPADPAADPAAAPPADPAATPPPAEQPTTGDGRKVSPWKLVDQFKERASKAEARILELEKQVLPEAKRKEQEERVSAMQKRMDEMTEDLRYFNAEKYDPEVLKAQQDYEGGWKRALKELSEISVIDGATNQPRAVNAQDLLTLVNMPLGEARALAKEAFGEFADDVMSHRKAVRELFEAKAAKLEELKKNGAARDQQRKEHFEKLHGDISNQIKTTWETEIAQVQAHEKIGKFFKPREGDDEWNAKLEKGYKLVDEAWKGNTTDPRLTPDQRAALVKRHVAVRNRAAAFEAMRLDYDRLAAKLESAEKKLAEYQESTPGTGGKVEPGTAPPPQNARAKMLADLRKLAK